MKSFFKFIKHHYFVLLISLVVSYLFFYVLGNFINQEKSYYEATFYVENIEEFNDELLNDENFLNSIKNSAQKYENIDISKMLKNNDFTYQINEKDITIITKAKYYDQFFLSASNSVGTRAKTFIKDCVLKINSKATFKNQDTIVTLKGHFNQWYFALYGLVGTCFVLILLIIILSHYHIGIDEKRKILYDNQNFYKNCFCKNYWKMAFKPLRKVKDITTISMLFALMLISKFIPIPSGFGNLGLSFTYLFFAIIACIYGPVYGFLIGILSDTIGFFLTSSGGGVFNFGYTLQAAFSGFIYGLCFYKTKIDFSKSLIARFFVNIFMNAIYGSFLFIFVTYFNNEPSFNLMNYLEKVKYYMFLISLPKNILYLLPQSILLYFVLNSACKVLERFKLISKPIILN